MKCFFLGKPVYLLQMFSLIQHGMQRSGWRVKPERLCIVPGVHDLEK